MKGVSTVIATILMLIITIALAGVAYMYISGALTGAMQGIEITDSYCDNGEVTLSIKNIGTTTIGSLNVKQTSPSDDLFAGQFEGTMEPGKSITYTDTCEGVTGRQCAYRISPPQGKVAIATVPCAAKPSSLVGWWDFNEESGTIAKDKSGNGNDCKLMNGSINYNCGVDGACPDWVDSKTGLGKALRFDALGDFLNCGNKSSLSISDTLTIEAWIKPNTLTPPDDVIIVRKQTGDNENYDLSIGGDGGVIGSPDIAHNDFPEGHLGLLWIRGLGNANKYWADSGPFPDTNWHHIAVVFNYPERKVKFFDNGVEYYSDVPGENLLPNYGNVTIGGEWLGVYGDKVYKIFNGIIDEVRIYNQALV